jgi:Protein of unknown function (DUF3300)
MGPIRGKTGRETQVRHIDTLSCSELAGKPLSAVRARTAAHLLGIVALPLLSFVLAPEGLRAQQADGGWRQSGPYYEQPAPVSQPGYDQRDYAQSSPYGQQSYARTAPDPTQQYPQQGYEQAQGYESAPALGAQQLEQFVAPIALYPDALVALVLTASTYPVQVTDADGWLRTQGNASPEEIAAGADSQAWDPSVKALTAFPQVLAEMAQNQQWTTDLGNAYFNQPQDVLAAVQAMRRRAQSAGNLQSSPQEAVNYYQGNIELSPPDPQEAYVPSYNPWDVYGDPVAPYPGFSLLDTLGSFLGSSPVNYGLGLAMSAFNHTSWGWLSWGLSWLGQSVLFHQGNYFSNSNTVADWGLPHGGRRAWSGGGGTVARLPNRTPRGYGYSEAQGQRFVRPPVRSQGNWPGAGGSYPLPERGYARPLQTSNRIPPPVRGPQQYRDFDTQRGSEPVYRGRPDAIYRGSQQAYNRMPSITSRPQAYEPPRYGSGFYGGSRETYGSRPAPIYRSPARSYVASNDWARGDFGRGSSRSFSGHSFAGSSSYKAPHSGGFHLFGGGGHAPKSFNPGRSFGGGHSSHSDHSSHGSHSGRGGRHH